MSTPFDRLAAHDRVLPGKITPHTGQRNVRIAGIRKFDLGRGYRLAYLNKGGHFVLLYVGTHDDCTCWIGNNRDIDPDVDRECHRVISDAGPEPASSPAHLNLVEEPDGTEALMESIDDRTLRRIFPGLCGKKEEVADGR